SRHVDERHAGGRDAVARVEAELPQEVVLGHVERPVRVDGGDERDMAPGRCRVRPDGDGPDPSGAPGGDAGVAGDPRPVVRVHLAELEPVHAEPVRVQRPGDVRRAVARAHRPAVVGVVVARRRALAAVRVREDYGSRGCGAAARGRQGEPTSCCDEDSERPHDEDIITRTSGDRVAVVQHRDDDHAADRVADHRRYAQHGRVCSGLVSVTVPWDSHLAVARSDVSVRMMERDEDVRTACFLALDVLRAQLAGTEIPYKGGLDQGFAFRGRRVPFLNLQKGIYRAAAQRGPAALSTQTSAKTPYDDEAIEEGFLYAYRAGSIDQLDNRALRAAHTLSVPVVYFVATRPGWYEP